MAGSNGWWARVPAMIDLGRGVMANVLGRRLGGRPLRDEGDACRRDIETRLRDIVTEMAGVRPDRIDAHALLDADLGIDPLDAIDLVTHVEHDFGVTFPEGELDALQTFEDLVLVTRALVVARRATEETPSRIVQARLRVTEQAAGNTARLERIVDLTPYDCEMLADDLGSTGRLRTGEILVPATASNDALALIERALLASRLGGTRTTIRRMVGSRESVDGDHDRTAERTPATNAAALRIARHTVDLLECLSDERGATVLHLASHGALFDAEIQAARARTNRGIAAFRTVMRSYAPALDPALHARLGRAVERLGALATIRAVVDDADATVGDSTVLDAYHDVSRTLTRYVWTLERGLPDPSLVPQQMCLSALVAASEAGGVEREMIGYALTRDELTPANRADVAALIAQQRTQLDLAMTNASDDIATLLDRCTDDPRFTSVAAYESQVLGVRPDRSPGIDPSVWFRAMSAKLERLHDVEVRQLDSLMREAMRGVSASYPN
jgi:acyl carrier protein